MAKQAKAPKKAPASTSRAKPPKKIKYPETFTLTSMSKCISDHHGITRNAAKSIVDDVFGIIHAGVMKGERVPVGTMGKAYIGVRPARKARLGRNPFTGEEIKIPAKRATKVPKFSFSKAYKEAVLKARIQKK